MGTAEAHREGALADLRVAITGRLASMGRDEAVRRIQEAGGSFVGAPDERTHLLVVGEGGPPLGEDGRLTAPLRTARELEAARTPLEILSEERFLSRLGLTSEREDLQRLFTTAQLARILEVPVHRIRTWVRHGLIVPVKTVRRLRLFDFPQVATARALARLASDGVTPVRIRRSLEELSSWLPEASRSLAQLEALEQGRGLFVRTPEGDLAETSGQLRLDFEEPADAPEVDAGEFWFRRGIHLEDTERREEAVLAYAKALDPKAPRPEVAFNLGNCLHSLERFEEAAQCFALATEVDPEYVEAWNNLGNALAEEGRLAEAGEAYDRALGVEPEYADAHFNLAEALASEGRFEEARPHWAAYLEIDPTSPWADEVRSRLRRTRE